MAADPVSPLRLMQCGSLFLTRPNLTHYIATRDEFERRAGDLYSWIAAGWLNVQVGERLPLAEAAAGGAAVLDALSLIAGVAAAGGAEAAAAGHVAAAAATTAAY